MVQYTLKVDQEMLTNPKREAEGEARDNGMGSINIREDRQASQGWVKLKEQTGHESSWNALSAGNGNKKHWY